MSKFERTTRILAQFQGTRGMKSRLITQIVDTQLKVDKTLLRNVELLLQKFEEHKSQRDRGIIILLI